MDFLFYGGIACFGLFGLWFLLDIMVNKYYDNKNVLTMSDMFGMLVLLCILGDWNKALTHL
jgi:hypothetical protein